MARSGQRMLRSPSGYVPGSGRTKAPNDGSTSSEPAVSMVSVMHFMPTQRPEKRDISIPISP